MTRFLSEKEHGIDIDAVTPDGKRKVSIEAKGETSSMSHSNRYGKAFSSSQVFDHVSKAFYCAARDSSAGLMAGVAIPRNGAHIQCVQKIIPALKTLGIEVFWALPDGSVEIERIWDIWDTQAR